MLIAAAAALVVYWLSQDLWLAVVLGMLLGVITLAASKEDNGATIAITVLIAIGAVATYFTGSLWSGYWAIAVVVGGFGAWAVLASVWSRFRTN